MAGSYQLSNIKRFLVSMILVCLANKKVAANTANVILTTVGSDTAVLTVKAQDSTPTAIDFNQDNPSLSPGPPAVSDPSKVLASDKSQTLTYIGLQPSTRYEFTLSNVKEGSTQGSGTAISGGTQTVEFCTGIAPIEKLTVDAAGTDDKKITIKWEAVAGRTHDVYLDGTQINSSPIADGTSSFEITTTDGSATPLQAGKDYTCKVVTSVSCDAAGDGSENINYQTYNTITCTAGATPTTGKTTTDCENFTQETKASICLVSLTGLLWAAYTTGLSP